jgi:putative selenate reductase molybdopterin-binding subunit
MELELRINGIVESLDVAPNELLLNMLRREGYDSVKRGCETGECGACTVLVDGVPRPSCVMLAAQAGGCTLMTVEHLRSGRQLHPLQQAFIEVGAVQCGFCTPGMLLSAFALLRGNTNPTEAEVRTALSGHLCRCTGYVKPVQAVMRAAALLRSEGVPQTPWSVPALDNRAESGAVNLTSTGGLRTVTTQGIASTTGKLSAVGTGMTSSLAAGRTGSIASAGAPTQVVGKAVPAIDAVKLATGKPAFAGDHHPRGMLYGRVLTSPHAHAVIRSIDVADARALPGVHAVLTYKDVPRFTYSSVERLPEDEGPHDHYCLDYLVRHVGDRVAVVAAETPDVAEQALRLVQVDYEIRPALLDIRQALTQALEPTALPVHPESESSGIADALHNVATRVRIDAGSVEQGFAEADVTVEGEYLIPQTQPAPLETHTVMTWFDEDGYLVVRTSTQVPHYVRRVLSSLLSLPAQRIRVVQPNVGGDFGLKQEVVLEDLCALLTVATNRPVMLTYSRAEEFRSRVRPAQMIRLQTGVKCDGTLVAQQMTVLANTGAYGTHPLTTRSNFAPQALSLYACPHQRFIAEVFYTNTPPSGAFRGYSMPEVSFAVECHMDEIAQRLGIDALELRRKNWIRAQSQFTLTGKPGYLATASAPQAALPERVESCALPQCLQLVEEKLPWRERQGKDDNGRFRKGLGIALAMHHDTEATISGVMMKLNEDGSCHLFAPVTGDGNFSTLLVQIAAEGIGVSGEDVHLHCSETNLVPTSSGSSVSALFYSCAGAVKHAAEQLRWPVLSIAGRMLHVQPDTLKLRAGIIVAPGDQRLTLAQVVTYALTVEHRHIMTTASWQQQQMPTSFAAHGVEVEVDTETGVIHVLKIVTAVDSGRVINPLISEGQIQGSIAQALGMAVSEELLYDQKGKPLATSFGSYHLLTMAEMPAMHTYLVETDEPNGPFGAKTGTEVALSGVAAALANAVNDALGTRIRQLPLTPEKLLRAIHAPRESPRLPDAKR